jgi:WD40 repeat protein
MRNNPILRRRSIVLGFLTIASVLTLSKLDGATTLAQESTISTPALSATPLGDVPSDLPVITAENADRLRPIASLSPGYVYGAEWSPDGKMLAVYGKEGLWLYTLSNLSTPRFFRSTQGVIDVAFSLDEEWIAGETMSETIGGVWLWNTFTDEMNTFVPNVASPIFTADSDTLVVRDLDRGASRILFLDILRYKYRVVLPDADFCVSDPARKVLACIENKQKAEIISIRDAKTGKTIRVLKSGNERWSSLAIDPSGKLLAAVGKYGVMTLWNVSTGQLLRSLGEDQSYREDKASLQFRVSFSHNSELVALVVIPLGRQAEANIWELPTGKHLDMFLTDYSFSIYFEHQTNIVIDDFRGDQVFLRGIERDNGFKVLSDISYPKFNPDRTLIAAFKRDRSVVLFAVH